MAKGKEKAISETPDRFMSVLAFFHQLLNGPELQAYKMTIQHSCTDILESKEENRNFNVSE